MRRSACGPTSFPRHFIPGCGGGPPQSQGFALVGALLIIPGHPGLHRLGLLRAPRQGHGERGLPLMWVRRLLWLFAIWSASVLALGVVALAMRGLMGMAGLIG